MGISSFACIVRNASSYCQWVLLRHLQLKNHANIFCHCFISNTWTVECNNEEQWWCNRAYRKPSALLTWMVSGPEVAHLISQFDSLLNRGQGSAVLHHEQTSSGSSFWGQRKPIQSQTPMGMDLYAMDLMVTVNGNNANSPKNLAEIDYGQYNFFVNDHLLNSSRPFSE